MAQRFTAAIAGLFSEPALAAEVRCGTFSFPIPLVSCHPERSEGICSLPPAKPRSKISSKPLPGELKIPANFPEAPVEVTGFENVKKAAGSRSRGTSLRWHYTVDTMEFFNERSASPLGS